MGYIVTKGRGGDGVLEYWGAAKILAPEPKLPLRREGGGGVCTPLDPGHWDKLGKHGVF